MSLDLRGFGKTETDYILQSLGGARRASACVVQCLEEGDAQSRRAMIEGIPRAFTLFVIRASHGIYLVPIRPGLGCLECVFRWTGSMEIDAPGAKSSPMPPFALDILLAMIFEHLDTDEVGLKDRPFSYLDFGSFSIRMSVIGHAVSGCRSCSPAPISQPCSLPRELENWDDHVVSSRAHEVESIGAHLLPILVDRSWGLISNIERSVSPGALRGISTAHLAARHFGAAGERAFGRTGATGKDRAISALEAVERYAAFRPRHPGPIVTSSYTALGSAAVDPGAFILPEPAQTSEGGFHLSGYSPAAEYDWVEAFSLKTRSMRLVPAQLAYFGYRSTNFADGGLFALETSNGCATGGSLLEAICYGLFEVIERDAFLTHWYGGAIARRVSVDRPACPALRGLLSRLAVDGLHLDIYDISTVASVTSLAVRITDPSNRYGPGVIFSAGSHVDPDTAFRSALSEAITFLQIHPEKGRENLKRRGDELLEQPELVQTMHDHLAQAWGANAPSILDFSTTGHSMDIGAFLERRGQFPPDEISLSDLVSEALEIADDILVVEQSVAPYHFPAVRCVKVLAPGLHPLTFGHQYRRISRQRLRQGASPNHVDPPFRREIRPHAFS